MHQVNNKIMQKFPSHLHNFHTFSISLTRYIYIIHGNKTNTHTYDNNVINVIEEKVFFNKTKQK